MASEKQVASAQGNILLENNGELLLKFIIAATTLVRSAFGRAKAY
jgi:hypothetical protein